MSQSKRKEAKASPSNTTDTEHRFDSSKPQFRKTSDKTSKVVLDDRFASVLTDPRFQLIATDKYGRRKSKKPKISEEVGAFYTVLNDTKRYDVGMASAPNAVVKETAQNGSASVKSKRKNVNESTQKHAKQKEVDMDDPATRISYLTALSRGELDVSSSSDDDPDAPDDDNSSDVDDDGNDSNLGENRATVGVLDPSLKEKEEPIELTFEDTPYMAVLNMDWSHVRAVDILAILASFTPPGAVKCVQVYPSDFGMERIKKEQLFGPVDLWKKNKTVDELDSRSVDSSESVDADDADGDGEESDVEADEEIQMMDPSNQLESENNNNTNANRKTGFDPEKLRSYEASRLKYYFAIAEFATPEFANVAYTQVDGMEFEHSSAAIDVRAIPLDSLLDVKGNRELRDQATTIPSNYVPPEFVVNALQQSTVQCTWDMGNHDRESLLTKYSSGQAWGNLTEGDDLNEYLASDHSSDEDQDSDDGKGTRMRKVLGLDSDDDERDVDDQSREHNADSDDDTDGEEEGNKQTSFIPGESSFSVNLKEKLATKDEEKEDITAWDKYLEKRKQKRREKRADVREKRKEVSIARKNGGVSQQKDRDNEDNDTISKPTDEELGLIVVGDDSGDETRDFNMRRLERLEKNKQKTLHGARKRKEDKLSATVSGADFQVDVKDERFKAVLQGSDDRFGIDLTDPQFKETSAMREILAEQTRSRKNKRKKNTL